MVCAILRLTWMKQRTGPCVLWLSERVLIWYGKNNALRKEKQKHPERLDFGQIYGQFNNLSEYLVELRLRKYFKN